MSNNNIHSDKILRFRQSERWLHWAISIPFMISYVSALILVVFYNPDPSRPFREVFSWIHKISGISLFVFPVLVMVTKRGDINVFFYNIRQAWAWTAEDFKWLCLKGAAAVNKRISLPEQGKFNAAEKLNFMVLMCTSPVYILTGLLIWLAESALLFWFIHFTMAIITTPLLLGHIFMAAFNPDTRKALSGMISGFVERDYVKHHHSRWYEEHFNGEDDKKKEEEKK